MIKNIFTILCLLIVSGYAGIGTGSFGGGSVPSSSASPSSPTVTTSATTGLVTLTHPTNNASIYYTTDGTAPTAASALYSGPFYLTASATTTVKAVAYVANVSSAASTATTVGVKDDADVAAWITNVTNVSGTVSANTRLAANDFMAGLNAAGLRSKIVWFNLVCGDFNATKVPIIGTSNVTYTNFVSGDYTEAVGLTGNSTNKYLDTGLVPSTAGLSLNGISLIVRITTSMASAHKMMFNAGTGATATIQAFPNYGGGMRSKIFDTYGTPLTENPTPGVLIWSRVSSTDLRAFRNGVQSGVTTTGIDTGTPPTTSVKMFRLDEYSNSYCDCTVTAYGFGLGLTPADAANLSALIIQFDAALGR